MSEWFDSIDWSRTLMLIGILALVWHVAVAVWAWKVNGDLLVRHLVLAPGLLPAGFVALLCICIFAETVTAIEAMKGD
jgi:hypothetical protein